MKCKHPFGLIAFFCFCLMIVSCEDDIFINDPCYKFNNGSICVANLTSDTMVVYIDGAYQYNVSPSDTICASGYLTGRHRASTFVILDSLGQVPSGSLTFFVEKCDTTTVGFD